MVTVNSIFLSVGLINEFRKLCYSQVDAIQQRLLENVDGVLAVHEFHVWQLAGDRIIASAHIRCRNLSEYMKIAEQVKEFFHNEGIHSTTIQPEFIDVSITRKKYKQFL